MKKSRTVLAVDLGASSGRVIKAVYRNQNIAYKEIHRFENCPYEADGHLRWNFSVLLAEIHRGIEKAGKFDSLGIDTWGVDFGLLDIEGNLLEDPVHYRDKRTDGILEEALSTMGAKMLYAETGTQILPINTLFQILALKKQQSKLLHKADKLLFMPDLFTYALCGSISCERSIASTGQILRLLEGSWSRRILDAFQLPCRMFPPIIPSGTVVGRLTSGEKVVTVAGHDTQCAVAALPAQEYPAAFLSCGTWSLLGCETDSPVLTEESMSLGLSNELGANGQINYLKNLVGLWLVQESRREWQRQGTDYSYAELEQLAVEAEPFLCFIDPDDPVFTQPGDIPARVKAYCASTNQTVPQTAGAVMRCIYESLAFKYRYALEQLQFVIGKNFRVLHILGGGSKDTLLCRMTAACTGLRVVAGPAEATALGNIMIQLVALGDISSIEAGRQIITQSEHLSVYFPGDTTVWDTNYKIFKKISISNTDDISFLPNN